SEPEMEKNGTFASPATARASSVLPVPGGPTSNTPFGMRPPSFWNFCASRRNSIISRSSSLASSTPATSLNVTFFCCIESKRARLHLPDHEEPQRAQQNQRSPGAQQLQRQAAAVGVIKLHVDALAAQVLQNFRSEVVPRRGGVKQGAVAQFPAHFHPVDGELLNFVLLHVTHELSDVQLGVFLAVARALHH